MTPATQAARMLRTSAGRIALLALLAVLAPAAAGARAGEPPGSSAPAGARADLARRLRSPDAKERVGAVAALARLDAAALREVLAAAADPEPGLETWARTLLSLAREARGGRQ